MIDFQTNYEVLCVVDGDGFKALHKISNTLVEFRLYGIDAPEIKKCKKLLQDEKMLQMPGQLLMELGNKSAEFLRTVIHKGSTISIVQENRNKSDIYGRQLCYAYLPDGSCINELLVSNGFAKAYNEYYCEKLPDYQLLNTLAKQNSKGLYSLVKNF